MKKYLIILFSLCLLIAFFAIRENNTGAKISGKTAPAASSPQIGIDLTLENKIIVFALLDRMMANPREALGKTVKIRGDYMAYSPPYENDGVCYHFVVLNDEGACCKRGMEFILPDGGIYPDPDPDVNTVIEVTGVFEQFDENGQTHHRIAATELIILK